MIELLNVDCLKYMATLKDKEFDLLIADPPYFKGVGEVGFYGSEFTKEGRRKGNYKAIENWDSQIPGVDFYNEAARVSKHQIIWGINYFSFITNTTGRIIWDKQNDDSTFSNCEIASCSLISSVKIFRHLWNGMLQQDMKNKEARIHPTQKPIALYSWLYKNYTKPTDRILDTHLGSGSSAIAAHYAGLDFVGCEIDADYFQAAQKRFKEQTIQLKMAL